MIIPPFCRSIVPQQHYGTDCVQYQQVAREIRRSDKKIPRPKTGLGETARTEILRMAKTRFEKTEANRTAEKRSKTEWNATERHYERQDLSGDKGVDSGSDDVKVNWSISKWLLTLFATHAMIYIEIFLNRVWPGGDRQMGFAETLKELSNPIRRDILVLLKSGRLSAGDISRHFDVTGATISYHLSQLKNVGLIFETKHKNFIYYEINTSVFEEVLIWLAQFQKGGNHDDHQ
jgi:DNA-binding transcriptional ArsR family regulator